MKKTILAILLLFVLSLVGSAMPVSAEADGLQGTVQYITIDFDGTDTLPEGVHLVLGGGSVNDLVAHDGLFSYNSGSTWRTTDHAVSYSIVFDNPVLVVSRDHWMRENMCNGYWRLLENGAQVFYTGVGGDCHTHWGHYYADVNRTLTSIGGEIGSSASSEIGFDTIRIGYIGDPSCQKPMNRTVDVLETGTLTAGSLDAQPALVGGRQVYLLDATFTVDALNLVEDTHQGSLSFGLDDLGQVLDYDPEYSDLTVTINGSTSVLLSETGAVNSAVLVGSGGTPVTVQVQGTLSGSAYNGQTVSLATLAMTATYSDGCAYNILDDGGMEQFPSSEAWGQTATEDEFGELYFGRANKNYAGPFQVLTNGLPACGAGHHLVGTVNLNDIPFEGLGGAPIVQQFEWEGGTLSWKARTRASGFSPWIHIQDTASSEIANLFGDGSYVEGNTSGDWVLRNGSIDLEEGVYNLVLDKSEYGSWFLQYVAYDDVAVSAGGVYLEGCDEYPEEAPIDELLTPTPTIQLPSPTPTMGTVTPTITPTPDLQNTYTPTPQPSVTITRTPLPTKTRTPTARATKTPTTGPSPTKQGTKPPTQTPVIQWPSATTGPTRTPYGTPGGPVGPYTPTPGNDSTATAAASITPDSNDGDPGPGDMPPGPGDGSSGDGWNPGDADCSRPANPWSIAGWVDFEFCRLFYFGRWHGGHSATLVAIPNRYATYEPMQTGERFEQSWYSAATMVATYQWQEGGMENVPPASGTDLLPGPDSPWNGGRISLRSGNADQSYSMYCNLHIQESIGTLLSRGFCWSMDVLRQRRVLGFFQLTIYIAAFAIGWRTLENILNLQKKNAGSVEVGDREPTIIVMPSEQSRIPEPQDIIDVPYLPSKIEARRD